MRSIQGIVPLLLFTLCTAQLAAQPATAPPTGSKVTLYVPLRAKHNGQLATLKPSDLALVDAGRPIDSREIQISPAAPNQEPLVTFLFDRLRPATVRNASRSAGKMLSGFSSHPMLLGVWSVDTQLHILQPYTADKSATDRVFALTAKPATLPAPMVDSSSAALLTETARLVSNQHAASPASWTYATLLAAAHTQRPRPGRKAIILFTEQPSLDGDAPDRFRELPQALRDANISLFVVDANALDEASSNQAMLSVAMGGQSATNYYTGLANLHSTVPGSQTQNLAPLQFQAMKDTIANLEAGGPNDRVNLLAQAAQTSGGAYVFADAGAKNLTRNLLAGLDNYVTVTYPVAAGQQDGRFHAVAVRSMRPDIAVTAQPGYFATALNGTITGTLALASPIPPLLEADPALLERDATATNLRLDIAALHFGHAASGTPTVLAVEVPLPQLHLEEDQHTQLFALHATVALELLAANGIPVARNQQEFRRRGALGSEPALEAQVLSLEHQVILPPGNYTLNATVRDWNANTFAKTSQLIAVTAQTGTSMSGQINDFLSDLILVHSLDVRSVDQSATDASPALQYGDRQVVPGLSGQLAPGTAKASLYFQLYTAPSITGAAAPVLSLTLSKGGKHLATLPLQPDTTHLDGIASHLFTISLNRGPGTYDIDVDLREGAETTTRHVSLLLPASHSANSTQPDSHDPATDAFVASREIALEASGSLAATPALTREQSATLLAATRENALTYSAKLPNFICQETISRVTDRSGTGAWKPRDVIVESLHYQDKLEQRTVLKVDGEKSSLPADHIEGARSNGEFGALLRAIFEPSAQAQFTWVQSKERDGNLLHVFRFNVPFESSLYTVTDHTNSQLRAAFHGLIVVDAATHAVRRLFLQTDGLPPDFGVRSSWIAMNYDYVQINNHDYLLPSHGEIGLQQGKQNLLLNRVEFTEYRRFGARSRLVLPGSPETPQ